MSEAHRRAQATYVKARTDRGDQKLTFWFGPEHRAKLDRLARTHGSRQAALEHIIEEARAPWKETQS